MRSSEFKIDELIFFKLKRVSRKWNLPHSSIRQDLRLLLKGIRYVFVGRLVEFYGRVILPVDKRNASHFAVALQ